MANETLRFLETQRGRPFQLSAVERELRELWKEASSGADTTGAVLRACVLNLIVWDEAGGTDPEALIAEVSRETPGRIFLLVLDPQIPEGTIWSEVSAVCHLRRGGGHICGEQIRLSCHPAAARLLPSAVQSLLLGELPVALWCPDGLPLEKEAFRRLMRMADQVLFDSATLAPGALRPALAAIDHTLREGRAAMDLAWSRLIPWRDQLAGVFEPPQRRRALPSLRRIEVEQAGEPLPSAASLYLLAWVAARLGWGHPTATPDADGLAWNVELPQHPGELAIQGVPSSASVGTTGDGEPVKLEQVSSPAPGGATPSGVLTGRAPGLSPAPGGAVLRLRLRTAPDALPDEIQLNREDGHVGVAVTPPDHAPLPSTYTQPEPETPVLLSEALDGRHIDAHYAQAVDMAISLLDAAAAGG